MTVFLLHQVTMTSRRVQPLVRAFNCERRASARAEHVQSTHRARLKVNFSTVIRATYSPHFSICRTHIDSFLCSCSFKATLDMSWSLKLRNCLNIIIWTKGI
jgi:hypothetical protein